MAQGRSFWQVIPERYGLSLDLRAGSLADIPAKGPLVLIANHPYGILDGLMMGQMLDLLRGDFRILARFGVPRRRIWTGCCCRSRLTTREAVALNLQTRACALDYLGQGGAIGVFPGGTVSTAATPFSRPMDPSWRNFTAGMITQIRGHGGAGVFPWP